MSMLWLFERLLAEPARLERELRDERQDLAATPAQDPLGPTPRRCRVCAYEGLEAFCPACLADTMVSGARGRSR
jgi:hypothetical protein